MHDLITGSPSTASVPTSARRGVALGVLTLAVVLLVFTLAAFYAQRFWLGRRSYTTSIAFGPTIGKNIALAYLPHAYCQEGRKLNIEYFAETYPVEVVGIGYKPLYDPENLKPRT